MTTFNNNLVFCIFGIALLTIGCKNTEQAKENKQISVLIDQQFNQKNLSYIDLAKVSDKSWDRVCIIGPYALNKAAEEVLGFKWDIEKNTEITSNDRISLLIFVKNNQVVEFVQHPRNKVDFSSGKIGCLPSNAAKFVI